MARKKLYELTPEHRAQLKPWADRWIANAMSTEPMTEADRVICRDAVRRLYEAAGKPPPKHVVFVPSPFVLAFAGGFAAAIWHRSNVDATLAATWATTAATLDATRAATWSATEAATWAATTAATTAATRAATEAATRAATEAATEAATWSATEAATRAATTAATTAATGDATTAATRAATTAATWSATRDATRDATGDDTGDDTAHWYNVPCDMRVVADSIGVGRAGLACATEVWRMWQWGNQWPSYDSYLSFFRHVARLPLDYTAWDAWETLSLHSGPRIVHQDFCMISDRPELLTVDDQNRPHADSGPFCRWRDGSALYSVHGTRIPAWVIEQPERLTVAAIDAEQNAEIRRVMLDRYGWARFMQDSGAERLDHDERWGTLYRRSMADDEPLVMVEVINRSPEPDGHFKHYTLRVPPNCRTSLEAVAWTFNMAPAEYAEMEAES